jgi:hypothetical protein
MTDQKNLELPEPEEPAFSILDESDPYSIVNLLPRRTREHLLAAAIAKPELFTQDEETFLAEMKTKQVFFNTTDRMLRSQFWIEYNSVRTGQRKSMLINNIVGHACTRELFENHYIKNHIKCAWLCVIPVHYKNILNSHLERVARQMGAIIDLPLYDKNGKLDHKVANLQLNLFKTLEVTLHGTPTQRIEQKTMSLNVTRNESALITEATGQSVKSLRERIRQLEALEREASHTPRLAEWQTMPVTKFGVPVDQKDDKE